MKQQLAYKYRFYPDPEQKELLAKTFGCCRFVYNRMLKFRTDSWHNGQRIGFAATCRELTKTKRLPEYRWLHEVSSVALQQSLRHLNTAFDHFFAKKTRYPKFKSKRGKQSATFANTAFRFDSGTRRLWLAKMPHPLHIHWSRKLPFVPIAVTISRDCAGRYFISFQGEEEVHPFPENQKSVGIDFGLQDFAVTSDGEVFEHPKYLKTSQARLTMLQQRLSRRKKGGKNWQKTKRQIAKLHAKISDCRKDFLHKLTTYLVQSYGHIITEDLSIREMMQNHCLAGAIGDSAWSEAGRQFAYKSAWYGRLYTKIDRFFPSTKRCFNCGYIVDSLPLSLRAWECPLCGSHHHRDGNASLNIQAVGLTVTAYGQGRRLLKGSLSEAPSCVGTTC